MLPQKTASPWFTFRELMLHAHNLITNHPSKLNVQPYNPAWTREEYELWGKNVVDSLKNYFGYQPEPIIADIFRLVHFDRNDIELIDIEKIQQFSKKSQEWRIICNAYKKNKNEAMKILLKAETFENKEKFMGELKEIKKAWKLLEFMKHYEIPIKESEDEINKIIFKEHWKDEKIISNFLKSLIGNINHPSRNNNGNKKFEYLKNQFPIWLNKHKREQNIFDSPSTSSFFRTPTKRRRETSQNFVNEMEVENDQNDENSSFPILPAMQQQEIIVEYEYHGFGTSRNPIILEDSLEFQEQILTQSSNISIESLQETNNNFDNNGFEEIEAFDSLVVNGKDGYRLFLPNFQNADDDFNLFYCFGCKENGKTTLAKKCKETGKIFAETIHHEKCNPKVN